MDHEQHKKTFDNTSSSYLSLKAELLRKKQDIQKASSASSSSAAILENLQSSSSSLKLKTNPDLDIEVVNSSKKKKKNEEIVSQPTPPTSSREDEIAFAKSRAILEAKSKLYDEIMSNSDMKLLAEDDGNEDEDKSFLVDFERKIYDTNQKNNKIEYTDSFGRTRLVTPDEYEHLKSTEKKTSHPKIQSNITENEIDRVERLHREQMRSKWEAEMEELRNKTHVHYQDVLFDEKRDHGVGFYKFSTDDKQRAEQMETLNDLRTNTKVEQNKFIQEKEKRQSNMADRLNKIRLRKAKEMGINLSENNQNDISSTTDIQEISNSSHDTKSETIEQVSNEKQKEIPLPPVIEQTLPTTQTQLQPSLQNSNPSLAYPFPVRRNNPVSSSIPTSHSSDKN